MLAYGETKGANAVDDTTLTAVVTDDAVASAGSGQDSFWFEATAAANGKDTISDFDQGGGGDVLDFHLYAIDGNSGSSLPGSIGAVLAAAPGSATAIGGTIQRLVDIAGGQDVTTAAGLTAALAAGGEFASLDMAAGSKAIIVTSATNGAADPDFVFFARADATGAITAELVATLAGGKDIDSWTAGNFMV